MKTLQDPDMLDNCSNAEIQKILRGEQRRLGFRKFCRNRLAVVGAVILAAVILCAIFAPWLTPYGPYDMLASARLQMPGAAHWFGTDTFGRDLLTRVLYGARISLVIGLATSLLSLAVCMICGLYASYYKPLDNVLMRICDGLSAVPASLLAIAFMAVMGASMKNVIISMAVVYMPHDDVGDRIQNFGEDRHQRQEKPRRQAVEVQHVGVKTVQVAAAHGGVYSGDQRRPQKEADPAFSAADLFGLDPGIERAVFQQRECPGFHDTSSLSMAVVSISITCVSRPCPETSAVIFPGAYPARMTASALP